MNVLNVVWIAGLIVACPFQSSEDQHRTQHKKEFDGVHPYKFWKVN